MTKPEHTPSKLMVMDGRLRATDRAVLTGTIVELMARVGNEAFLCTDTEAFDSFAIEMSSYCPHCNGHWTMGDRLAGDQCGLCYAQSNHEAEIASRHRAAAPWLV